MDSFAGSEPRNFISFRLDKEKTGQPVQDSSNTIATPASPSSPDEHSTNPASGDKTNQQGEPMDAESTQPQTPVDPASLSRLLASDSSGSGESCGADFARKLQDVEGQTVSQPLSAAEENPRNESTSEQIEVTAQANSPSFRPFFALGVPRVTFLDDPKASSDGSQSPECENPLKRSKITRLPVEADSSFNIYSQRPSSLTPTVHTPRVPAPEGQSTSDPQHALSCTTSDGEARTDIEVRTDAESSDFVGSTLAQALKTRVGVARAEFSDDSASIEVSRPKDISVIPPLRVSSRALIKEYFAKVRLSI